MTADGNGSAEEGFAKVNDPGLPQVVSWNLTARCNLACEHCYIDAGGRSRGDEADTAQCLATIDQLADLNPGCLLIMTGGEPLLRPDLHELTRAASDRGMTVVLGSNGTLIDRSVARGLAAAGVSGVGISLDSLAQPGLHDRFRGCFGAWQSAVDGMKACRDEGLDFLVQTSVFSWNRDELATMADYVADLGATSWNVYFLVCTGRGQGLTDLPAAEYELVLAELAVLRQRIADRTMLVPRCAPQFKRVADGQAAGTLPTLDSGCPAAGHYLRIDPRGRVTPCPYIPIEAGRIEPGGLAAAWYESPLFASLRNRSLLGGRCGRCEWRDACGGCRARALASGGELMAEDPACAYQPGGGSSTLPVGDALYSREARTTMPWSEEARDRLQRIPSFVRGLVVERVERQARGRGVSMVTSDMLRRQRPSLAAVLRR